MTKEMPDEIWSRPLMSGGGKCLSSIRPESPLIEQNKDKEGLFYTSYTRTDLIEEKEALLRECKEIISEARFVTGITELQHTQLVKTLSKLNEHLNKGE